MTDLDIAQRVKLFPIIELAQNLGVPEDLVLPCGNYKAKISLQFLAKIKNNPKGRLILVTAITPTAYGEGKTTIAIGLSMAFNRLGKRSIVTLREPSLGPVFGIKGGATGGGYSQVLPMEDINLHFTGDLHAITSAHNLLAAMLDNHIHFGNRLAIDEREIVFRRSIDMNDRALRTIVVGLGGRSNGPVREDGFIISAASEIMGILGLSRTLTELKTKLCKILVAFTQDQKPITAGELGACGAMAVLLRDAIKPNLVQTIEHTPAFIHTGPFANIAFGTNSVVATEMALHLSDYVVTETGFGSDLGLEKFVDIVARYAGFEISACVLVVTIRALKLHGGANAKKPEDGTLEHLRAGLPNLGKHIENIRKFKVPLVVALNLFDFDTEDEIRIVEGYCENQSVLCVLTQTYQKGGEGAIELAEGIEKIIKNQNSESASGRPIYDLADSVVTKIEKIATEIYGANRVVYTPKAERDLEVINKLGFDKLPVCIAKTHRSFSDNPNLYGLPKDFKITITGINIQAGAGYLVPIAGEMVLMPGLAKLPNALKIDLDSDGRITGLS